MASERRGASKEMRGRFMEFPTQVAEHEETLVNIRLNIAKEIQDRTSEDLGEAWGIYDRRNRENHALHFGG